MVTQRKCLTVPLRTRACYYKVAFAYGTVTKDLPMQCLNEVYKYFSKSCKGA